MEAINQKNPKFISFPIKSNRKNHNRLLHIFETHDVAILCWLSEKIRLDLENNLFLLTIDNHVDLPDISVWDNLIQNINTIKKLRKPKLQLESLRERFQSLFKGHDVNFIVAALELDLIQGCLIVSPENDDKIELIEHLKGSYTNKNIYKKHYLTSLFYPNGHAILNDRFDHNKITIRNAIYESNLLLDLDLDYFTYFKDDRQFPISEDHFRWILDNEEISTLFLENAVCVTIAMEKLYCGNKQNCKKIFERMMQFFDEIDLIESKPCFDDVMKELKQK